MKSSHYKVIINSCLFLAAIFATLFFVEILLRFGFISNEMQSDVAIRDEIQSKLKLKTNNKRLLILGDSFIKTGQYLDQQIKDQLATFGIDVLNLAASGYSPVEYLATLKRIGISYKPDTILLCYYAGNDLADVKRQLNKDGTLKSDDGRMYDFHKSYQIDPAMHESYLAGFLNDIQRKSAKKKLLGAKFIADGTNKKIITLYEKDLINPSLVLLGRKFPDFFISNLLLYTDDDRAALRKIEEILREIKHIAKQLNAQFSIIVFPNTAQVSKYHFTFYKRFGFQISDELLTANIIQRRIGDFCRENQISYLDLLPSFRKNNEKLLYWKTDDHLNTAGQHFAADKIVEFLKLKNSGFD